MTRTIGRIVVALALALSLVWTLIPLVSDGATLWELASRFDILTAVLLVGGVSASVAAIFAGPAQTLDRVACFIAGGAAAILVFFALESSWQEPLRAVFGCFLAVALVGGATLLSLSAEHAERLAGVLQGTRTTGSPAVPQPHEAAAQPAGKAAPAPPAAPAPTMTPEGWYPDPSGQFSTRYWDGGAWTERVQ